MSDHLGQSAFNALVFDYCDRVDFVESWLEMALPERYQIDSVESSEQVEIAFTNARNVVYSLVPTIGILLRYTANSEGNRNLVLKDLKEAMALPDFWNACESHGALVGEINNTKNHASGRKKFRSKVKDPDHALAASHILESLATSGGSAEANDFIRRSKAEVIAGLLKVSDFPAAEFVRLLDECSRPDQQIENFLPITLDEILQATPTDRARACWISHHLWTMEPTSRCILLSRSADSATLKNLSKLTQKSRDGLFATSTPALSDFDTQKHCFPSGLGRFSPRLDLMPMQ